MPILFFATAQRNFVGVKPFFRQRPNEPVDACDIAVRLAERFSLSNGKDIDSSFSKPNRNRFFQNLRRLFNPAAAAKGDCSRYKPSFGLPINMLRNIVHDKLQHLPRLAQLFKMFSGFAATARFVSLVRRLWSVLVLI